MFVLTAGSRDIAIFFKIPTVQIRVWLYLGNQYGYDVKEKSCAKTVFHLVTLSQFTKKKKKNARALN